MQVSVAVFYPVISLEYFMPSPTIGENKSKLPFPSRFLYVMKQLAGSNMVPVSNA